MTESANNSGFFGKGSSKNKGNPDPSRLIKAYENFDRFIDAELNSFRDIANEGIKNEYGFSLKGVVKESTAKEFRDRMDNEYSKLKQTLDDFLYLTGSDEIEKISILSDKDKKRLSSIETKRETTLSIFKNFVVK